MDPQWLYIQFFLAASHLGDQAFYLVIVPIVYWCHRKGFGADLAIMLLTTYWISLSVKEALKVPRPPRSGWVEGANPVSYSFPSGHALGNISFWGYMVDHIKRYWVVAAGAAWVLMVSTSRVVLGVHRWEDIIGGWAIGAAVVVAFVALRGRAVRLLERLDHLERLSLAVAFPIILFVLLKTVVAAQLTGFLLGTAAGAEIERTSMGMRDCRTGGQRVARAVIGFPICSLFLFGLGGQHTDVLGWQFASHAMAGMAVTLFAPMAFRLVEENDDGDE